MCHFTHIFSSNFRNKTTKNTQIDHNMLQISLDCVFMCFRYKRIENKAKTDKTELEMEKCIKDWAGSRFYIFGQLKPRDIVFDGARKKRVHWYFIWQKSKNRKTKRSPIEDYFVGLILKINEARGNWLSSNPLEAYAKPT